MVFILNNSHFFKNNTKNSLKKIRISRLFFVYLQNISVSENTTITTQILQFQKIKKS
jgi:hypothetical protein